MRNFSIIVNGEEMNIKASNFATALSRAVKDYGIKYGENKERMWCIKYYGKWW